MKALVQRVSEAGVEVSGSEVSSIGRGLLVFLCVMKGDTEMDIVRMAGKVANLRIFEDAGGKMNLSVKDVGGEALVVPQFTLAADASRGNRPSFQDAEVPQRAQALYDRFIEALLGEGVRTRSGRFAASMAVRLVNDGPVTVMLESARR